MDKHVQYTRLMIKVSQQSDNRKLQHINKPDPIILGLKQKLALFLIDLLDRVGYNRQ